MVKYIYTRVCVCVCVCVYVCMYVCMYVCIYKAIHLIFKLPTHCNLIGRSLTTPPPVLSPSNILPPPSSHCAFTPATKKFGGCLKNVIFFFTFLKKRVCRRVLVSDCGSQEFSESRDHVVAILCFRNFPASNVLLETGYPDLGRLWFSSVFPSKCPDSTLD